MVVVSPARTVATDCSADGSPLKKSKSNVDDDTDENVKLWKTLRSDNSFPLIVAGNEKIVGSSRPGLAGILGVNFGDKYLSRTEKRYFENHFYRDGSPKIVMYGADWCGYCKKLREEFQADNIDFIEIDVEKTERKRHWLKPWKYMIIRQPGRDTRASRVPISGR